MSDTGKGWNAIWNQFLRFLGEPLQEDNGNYSGMRLMGFLALGASIYFGTLIFAKNTQQQSILQQSLDLLKQPQELSGEKKALLEEIINTQKSKSEDQSQNDFSEEFWIVFSFLSFSFGGKFAQKIVESKEGRDFTKEEKDFQLNLPVEIKSTSSSEFSQIEAGNNKRISANTERQKTAIANSLPNLDELRDENPMRE